MSTAVRYHVSPANPNEHLFEVEASFPTDAPHIDLWMPVWTPGSYLVREFSRHVQEFRALHTSKAPLAAQRLDKNTWRVPRGAAPEVRVRYRVYANELTVRTSHLDASHGYFNGANLLVTSDAHRALPCELTLGLPGGWNVHCALPRDGDVFRARDYDELIDSPVELGPQEALVFTAAGARHELVIWGRGNFEAGQLTKDLAAICEAEAKIFGGLPNKRFLFLVHLTDKGRGGLEHAASTTLLYPRFGFRPRKSYEDFLALAAHEYFHLWNVKRITPRAFVPFDYRKENYTGLLWAMEGITSYYDTFVLRRAGLIDAARYLVKAGEIITGVESTPSRKLQSLAEASFSAWIKHYRPDEHTPNSAISYYVKGEVVALLLDLHLRLATRDERSLDDVMRLLFERYGRGEGVPEDAVEAIACEVGGPGLRAFFAASVHGTSELDYSILAAAGLTLKRRVREGAADKGGAAPSSDTGVERAFLGAEIKGSDRPTVGTVFTGSPAALGGLSTDDEIVAIDGFKVTAASLQERLDERRPGDPVTFTLFRRDELRTLAVTLGERPREACWIEKLPDASPAQKVIYQRWLGEAFDTVSSPSGRASA
jgi:predicted metalloprotease with PDZ domain